jgi:hypothetical protein
MFLSSNTDKELTESLLGYQPLEDVENMAINEISIEFCEATSLELRPLMILRPNPYIKAYINKKKIKTKSKSSTLSPQWFETFTFKFKI